MLINDPDLAPIQRILNARSDIFSDLIRLSGLDPSTDLIDSDLRMVDFRESNLSDFNLEYADLRGCKWEGVGLEPSHFRFSLRGRANDPIRARDFNKWAERALRSRVWAERFYAFKCIVDNFGENYLTLDLLRDIRRADKSTYMKSVSTLYLSSSLYQIKEIQSYCEEMAQGSNSRVNMFRMMKIRRYARELSSVVDSLPSKSLAPGRFEPRELKKDLDSIWQNE